ncbi:MAG: hypothetical protein NVS3B17_08780 [Vulcanimicrobiaceae bacterium]
MIRELSRKEFVERKPFLAIGFTLVLAVTAILPFFFSFSLQHAIANPLNENAQSILRNFRSYAYFVESDWLASNLSHILCLLALIAGAGAIAGEREAKTLPLLYTSSVPLRSIVVVKFVVIAAWLFLVTFASLGVLAAHSLLGGQALPAMPMLAASVVAWGNALAFLGVVFAASAFSRRTIVAAGCALVLGFGMAAALSPLGLNGTAFATNIFAVDGTVRWPQAWSDLLLALTIGAAGMLATFVEVDRRRAT